MNILIIGSGGREHALVWKLLQSPQVQRIYCAPGNAGIAEIAEIVPLQSTDISGLLKFAYEHQIDMTVVGPEQPLMNGIVDEFEAHGLKIFGPTKAAAEIEGSKSFAKRFMKQYHIPTAEFHTFDEQQFFDAERFVNEIPVPIVIKADGLAAGKGVVICESKEKALETLDSMMRKKAFGDAGTKVVIEEFLVGEEASILVLTDGKRFVTLIPAQDHKRIFDHDQGKNTGGMGAYAPAPVITPELLEIIQQTIIRPVLHGMEKEGRLYKGCLYVGLMITETGPKVIEFNCRFGDPETQVVLPILKSDLADLFAQICNGILDTGSISLYDRSAVCVVIVSGGYPDNYETGKKIIGLDSIDKTEDVVIFHAGTSLTKQSVVTAGGRVIGVTAWTDGGDLESAITKAYRTVHKITFDGAYYRSDIGKKGLEHLSQAQQRGNS